MTPALRRTAAPAGGDTAAAENRHLREQLATARESLDRHQDELVRVRREAAAANELLLELEARNAALQQEKANLAKLYVATSALHATLDREEVLCALQEVLINLVGTEEFGIYERSEDDSALRLLAGFGIGAAAGSVLPAGDAAGRVLATGEVHVDMERADPAGPAACIPLCAGAEVTGAVVVYQFLPQKFELTPFDFELFDLVARQAATALRATGAAA